MGEFDMREDRNVTGHVPCLISGLLMTVLRRQDHTAIM
jgi:hypothetical protein